MNRTTVYDKPTLRYDHGYLLVSNHQSSLDSWFVGHTCFPRPVWFPAKSELFQIPIARHVIAGWRAFPVKRGMHDYEAMAFTAALLQKYIVLIHPEGTRNPGRELKPGKPGVGKIIHDARCTVIPVYFEGMDKLLPRGRIMPSWGNHVPIIFGEPIDFSDLFPLESSLQISEAIVARVMQSISELQRVLIAHLENEDQD